MANRDFKDVQALEREVKILAFRLTGINGGPPVATPNTGIASVAQAGGDITITLEDKYSSLLSCQLTLGATDGAAAATLAAYETDTVSSAGTMTFYTVTGGSAADPTNGATLLMVFDVKNSSVK